MKMVTMLLPDKMIHNLGTSISTTEKEVDITPENLALALTMDDYHERYKFLPEDIQIVTIEELLTGKEIKYPEWSLDATHKKAERKKKIWGGEQIVLL